MEQQQLDDEPVGRRRQPAPSKPLEPPPTARRSVAGVVGVVVLLGLVGIVVPLVIAARGGAFGIPRSDDWSYLLTLFRFSDTGRISFNNWVSMTLVGQIALSAPVPALLGRNVRAVQVFTAFVGLGGLVTVVALGRQLLARNLSGRDLSGRELPGGTREARSVAAERAGAPVFVALMVAVSPLWAPLAISYMTDIPAFTAGMVTLLCGVVGLQRRRVSIGWIVASLVAGFVAFSIRQYAIVPALAVAIAAAWALTVGGGPDDRRRVRQVVIATAVLLVAAAFVFSWWRGYSNAKSLSPGFPTPHSVWDGMLKGTEFVRLMGLLVSPALLLARPSRLVRHALRSSRALTLALGGGMLVLQVGVFLRVRETPFVGNYLARDGVLARAVLDGERPDVIPRVAFDLLVLVGSAAAIVLAIALVPFLVSLRTRVRSRRFALDDPAGAAVVLTVVGFGAAYLIAVVTELPLYDRYALPFVPLVSFQLLRVSAAAARPPVPGSVPAPGTRRGSVVLAGVALGLLAVVGLAFAVDSAAFDGTRWEVAQRATDAGYPARKVNGGFEWVNWHRGTWKQRSSSGELVAARRQRQALYCVVVVVNPTRVPPGRVIAREVSDLPFRDRAEFVAIRTNRSCPAADARAGR